MKRMETYKFNNGGKGLVGFILLLLAKQLQGQGPICYIHVIVNDIITCKTEVSLSDGCWWRAPISVSVTVSCGVSFRVEPRVSWCREDGDTCLPLKSQSRHTLTWNYTGPGTGVSYLTLHNITLSDSGYYRCYVSLPDYCGPNTRISRPLKLNVTRSGEVFEHCGEDDHPICDLLTFVDDFTILFVIATLVVMSLILCWFLKARGKCSPPEGNEVELPRVEPEQNIPPDTEKGAEEDPDEVYDDCV